MSSALDPLGGDAPPSPFAGRYAILGVLGRGSASTVYRAQDLVAGHEVALKVLDPRLSWDPNAVERLRREVVVSRRVTHPGIVRVHDLVCASGQAAIVQDLVVGKSLADVLAAAGPLPVPRALAIAEGALTALSACHAKGVLHRDIKPSNVLLEAGDRVRLVDFGIARVGLMTTVTHTGALLGTPGYQAPEILRGERADLRADLYGVGLLLFEMLAGAPAFGAGADATALFRQLAPSPPDLATQRRDLPAGLAALVTRLLDPHPEMRPAGAYEVIEAFQDLAASALVLAAGPACSSCGYVARARMPFCPSCGHYRRITLRPGGWFVRLRGVDDGPGYLKHLKELFGDALNEGPLRRPASAAGGSFILARGVSRETAEALAEDARRHRAGSECGTGLGWLQLHEEVRGGIIASGGVGVLLTLLGLLDSVTRLTTTGGLSSVLLLGLAAVGVMAFLVARASRPVLGTPSGSAGSGVRRLAHAETLAARIGRVKAGPLQATLAGLIEAYWETRAGLLRTAAGPAATASGAALERLLDKALTVGEKAGALGRLLETRGPHEAARDLETIEARRRAQGPAARTDSALEALEAAVREETLTLEAADDLLSTTAGQIVLATGVLRRVGAAAAADRAPERREAELLELLGSADLDIDTLERMIEQQAHRPHENTLGVAPRPGTNGGSR